jgi:hypothetical protein
VANVPELNPLGRCYFGIPAPPKGVAFPARPRSNPVLAWKVALDEARRGKFDNLPRLLEAYDYEGEDPELNDLIAILLGDAGPGACFPPLIRELETPTEPADYELALDFSEAVAIRGRLADVPLLLTVFERYATIRDADIIPVQIAELLWGPASSLEPSDLPSLEDYRAGVIAAYQDLATRLGDDRAYVFRGERFSVVRLAEIIRDELHEPYFDEELRRKFEACTGINCSVFYRREELQPLAAEALIENFLEGPEAERYDAGVRYFFRHRIPD